MVAALIVGICIGLVMGAVILALLDEDPYIL